jgi:hypothetical protein
METISDSVSNDADPASIDGFVIASDAMEQSNFLHRHSGTPRSGKWRPGMTTGFEAHFSIRAPGTPPVSG